MNLLKTLITDHLEWTGICQPKHYTRDEFLNIWISWLLENEFIKTFGALEGYIILRPVRAEWIFQVERDYFENLFVFDPHGNTVWIDSLWAPGRYKTVLELLRATRRTYVAWCRTEDGTVYLQKIADLSGHVPVLSQVRSARVHIK